MLEANKIIKSKLFIRIYIVISCFLLLKLGHIGFFLEQ